MSDAKVAWYGDDLIKRIEDSADDALFEAGQMLLEEAKGRAPRHKGRYAESGYVSSMARSTYRKKKGYLKERRPTKRGIVVIGFAWWKRQFLEFGTAKMRSKAHMRPSLDSLKTRLGKKITTEIGRDLKAIRGKKK